MHFKPAIETQITRADKIAPAPSLFELFKLRYLPIPLADATFQSIAALRPARRVATVVRASSDPLLQKPSAPTPPSQPAAAPVMPVAPTGPSSSGISIEYQRQQAKAMQQYFKDQAFEEVVADAKYVVKKKKKNLIFLFTFPILTLSFTSF